MNGAATAPAEPGRAGSSLVAALRGFFPGYFALVMATGIVSLAAHFCGHPRVASVLLWINLAAYGVIWTITLARLVFYPGAVLADLTQHAKGATFLTVVAATCVLGSQLVILSSAHAAGFVLWLLGLLLWTVLIYAFFAAMTVAETKPPLEKGINGGWLLAVVSTESLCVLGTLVAPARPSQEIILFLSLLAYLVGAMLYVILMALILYRWLFFSLPADTMTPPYWINMGALAITTLAGSRLLLSGERLALPAPARRLPGGLHPLLLGHGHLVDPTLAPARFLAPPAPARAHRLRPAVLVARVPPRHVRGRHVHAGKGHRPHPAGRYPAARRVPGAPGLASHLRGDAARARPHAALRWRDRSQRSPA